MFTGTIQRIFDIFHIDIKLTQMRSPFGVDFL